MSNKAKDISTYYIFDDINIKSFDPNNIKIDQKSCKNILIYYIGYVKINDSKYIKINSVSPLYLTINKMIEYFEQIYKIKYLTLVPTNESKEKIKIYEELEIKIRSMTKNSDDYDEKYIQIMFNLNDELPPNKMIEIPSMIIVVTAVFHENNK